MPRADARRAAQGAERLHTCVGFGADSWQARAPAWPAPAPPCFPFGGEPEPQSRLTSSSHTHRHARMPAPAPPPPPPPRNHHHHHHYPTPGAHHELDELEPVLLAAKLGAVPAILPKHRLRGATGASLGAAERDGVPAAQRRGPGVGVGVGRGGGWAVAGNPGWHFLCQLQTLSLQPAPAGSTAWAGAANAHALPSPPPPCLRRRLLLHLLLLAPPQKLLLLVQGQAAAAGRRGRRGELGGDGGCRRGHGPHALHAYGAATAARGCGGGAGGSPGGGGVVAGCTERSRAGPGARVREQGVGRAFESWAGWHPVLLGRWVLDFQLPHSEWSTAGNWGRQRWSSKGQWAVCTASTAAGQRPGVCLEWPAALAPACLEGCWAAYAGRGRVSGDDTCRRGVQVRALGLPLANCGSALRQTAPSARMCEEAQGKASSAEKGGQRSPHTAHARAPPCKPDRAGAG